MFHYNGHGVPKPTVNGEIWVFNKEFTQYIPLSLYEVQTWMGTPSFYVWDCSNAGIIIQNFLAFEDDRENEVNKDALQVTTLNNLNNKNSRITIQCWSFDYILVKILNHFKYIYGFTIYNLIPNDFKLFIMIWNTDRTFWFINYSC